jgi:hypothetical protein
LIPFLIALKNQEDMRTLLRRRKPKQSNNMRNEKNNKETEKKQETFPLPPSLQNNSACQ